VRDGDGDLGDGAGAGTGVGDNDEVGGATIGDEVGVAVGEIFGVVPGACAMHEVAKRVKSTKIWNLKKNPSSCSLERERY
ncbi:unnamed protein product, partial [Ilex paraguariensis]